VIPWVCKKSSLTSKIKLTCCLENNLKQLQTELNDQVKKQTKQEQVVINGIKSILKNEEAAIFSKAVSKGASLKDFENFCKLLGLQVQKHSKVLQEELNSIRVSMQSFQLQSAIDEIKTSMMKEQERLIAMIHQKSKSDYQARFARLTEIASQLNVHEHLRLQTNNGIQMIKQVNAEMEAEQNQLEQQNANDIPDEIKQLVTHEITQLESLFQSKMTESQEKAIKEHKERVEALKKETTKIVDAIAQHKFMVDDVRIGINTMRDPTLESNANQEIMMKQMESAHHDIIQINNKLNTKIKEMEELVETPFNATFSPKKRVRAEGEDLNAKIQDADTYIQQLDDYVSQFKEAILEPMFPTRVEAAMNKIQHILV
jgi:chromosome segregation ATPase